jgi:ATP-binding cassette subfamily B protein
MSSTDDLPAAFPSMWRAVKRAYAAEPSGLASAFALALFAALPDALLALWFKLLADGLINHNHRLAIAASLGLAVSATATWFLRVVSDRVQRRFRIGSPSRSNRTSRSCRRRSHLEHREAPIFSTDSVLRNQVFVLDHTCRCSRPVDGF